MRPPARVVGRWQRHPDAGAGFASWDASEVPVGESADLHGIEGPDQDRRDALWRVVLSKEEPSRFPGQPFQILGSPLWIPGIGVPAPELRLQLLVGGPGWIGFDAQTALFVNDIELLVELPEDGLRHSVGLQPKPGF